MRFTLDEPLFPLDHALPGLLTPEQIIGLEEEWKAAKVDEWCAVTRLAGAADRLRRAVGLPDAAPMGYVLCVVAWPEHATDGRCRRALRAYEDAATAYEGVRVALADIRNRTVGLTPPA